MVIPLRAPVSPRIISRFSGVPILLEDDVRDWLDRHEKAQICVQGQDGSGKTVALQHLAAVLQDRDVLFFDDSLPDNWDKDEQERSTPMVFSARVPAHFLKAFHVCHLAPWSEDDCIEYLLATHRDQCGSVIRRLHAADDVDLLRGVPELCRLVLDHMAKTPQAGGARDSVHAILRAHLRSEQLLQRIRMQCQGLLLEPEIAWKQVRRWLMRSDVAEADIRILRHPPVQVLLSAEVLLQGLIRGGKSTSPNAVVPHDLIEEAGARVSTHPRLQAQLEAVFVNSSQRDMPIIASILHRAVDDWRPTCPARFYLHGAELSGVGWRDFDMSRADLSSARLVGADLRRTKLQEALLDGAYLKKALLTRSQLSGCSARSVELSGADLTRVRAQRVDFRGADATDVEAEGADFRDSHWAGARMSDSNFVGADFSGADLSDAEIARADFSNANFDGARLCGLELHESLMLGASFRRANLEYASLECMILPDVDFIGANLHRGQLTGSVIPDGQMLDANLTQAELADVSWEHADLRGADLRGASFHAGTTRDGVKIGVQPPGWEHPPIYPDDEIAQDYLPPEAIRKANLCGVDLRNAKIDGVDFYLVDLRHAKYDADQAEYLRQSGAILQNQG
jgi:uncharacterized protein YjbI with pentapeptide repeats